MDSFLPSLDWAHELGPSLIWIAKAWVITAVITMVVLVLLAKFTVWGRQYWRITGDYLRAASPPGVGVAGFPAAHDDGLGAAECAAQLSGQRPHGGAADGLHRHRPGRPGRPQGRDIRLLHLADHLRHPGDHLCRPDHARHLPDAALHHPVAHLAHEEGRRRLAGRPGLLPPGSPTPTPTTPTSASSSTSTSSPPA